jgi:4-coumarate--CoA ligase
VNETQTVVVGKSHPTLGQEPVAILESFNGKSADDLAGRVIETFGTDWKLGGAIEMNALGLKSFPLNATGKIQKSEITPLVDEYMKSK